MAVVGEAWVVVRALTSSVERDIQKGFEKVNQTASQSGKKIGTSLNQGMAAGLGKTKSASYGLGHSFQFTATEAEKARETWVKLVRTGYVVQGVVGALTGSVSALVGGLGAMGGAAAGAALGATALGNALLSVFAGVKIASLGLRGVVQAATALYKGTGGGGGIDPLTRQRQIDDALRNLAQTIEDNQRKILAANNQIRQSQLALNEAFKQGKEEIQQIGFAAEEAALSEKQAAIDLERARESLARVQDLPPNSRARREAELAFQQAELNYRMAKDKASDLAKEQDRLARTGVEGTDVVKNAREDLANAEQNLSDTVLEATRAEAEAYRQLDDALRGVKSSAGGAADAMQGLTESQKTFVKYLVSTVIPKFQELKAAVADNFLPALQTQLDRLLNGAFFDTLLSGFAKIGTAAGDAVKNLVDAMVNAKNVELFGKFLQQVADLLPQFGTIFGNVWGIVLRLLDASSLMTRDFVSFLEAKSDAFKNFLDVKSATGELQTFFSNVERMASKVGSVLGNVFGGFGAIIAENVKPGSGGDKLITWLDKVSAGFKNADPTFLHNFFNVSADNFIAAADAFSVLINSVVKAGASPDVAKFWNIMASGATYLDAILRESVKVAPSIAALTRELLQFAALLADSGQAKGFFDTLTLIVEGLNGFLESIKPALDFVGPFLGALSALGLVVTTTAFALKVMVGFFELLIPAQVIATAGASAFGLAVKAALGPIGLIIGLISAAVLAYNGWQQSMKDSAVDAVSKGFEKGASAADTFRASLLAIPDGETKNMLSGLTSQSGELEVALLRLGGGADAVGRSFQSYSVASDGYMYSSYQTIGATKELGAATQATAGQLVSTTGLKSSLSAIGKSLGDLAVKELPDAQTQFKGFTDGMNLSRDAQIQALLQMTDYTTQLKEQASLMGVDLYNAQTGAIDNEKLLTFARGEGQIALINQKNALVENIQKMAEGSQSATNLGQAFKDSMSEAGFSIDTYLQKLEGQWLARQQVAINTAILLSKGMSQDAIDILVKQGDQGFQTMANLAQQSSDKVKQASSDLVLVSGEAGTAVVAVTSQALTAIGDKYGKDTMGKVAQAMKDTGKTIDQVMGDMNLSINNFNPTLSVKTDTAKSAVKTLQDNINGISGRNVEIGITQTRNSIDYLRSIGVIRKDGGIIPVPRFAAGGGVWSQLGRVRGPGTGRSDSVPALLSAGEYVVNAAATARFLPLLQAINEGRVAASQLQSNMNSGSTTSGANNASAGPTINITVNPSAGMDERELAASISREISFQMRKGSVA